MKYMDFSITLKRHMELASISERDTLKEDGILSFFAEM